MYRSDGFLVPQVEKVRTGIYHDLAEAIRRGCAIRPKKVKRRLRHGECGADALGAAAAGCGMSKRYTRRCIAEIFPELGGYVQHPISGRPGRLGDVVVLLNDQTDYTREQIADWLCRLGGCEHPVSSFFPSPPSPDQPPRGPGVSVPVGDVAVPRVEVERDFVVPSVEVGRYHRVAEAIRRGCQLRPKKIRRYYSSGNDGACALGAAMFGVGKNPPKRNVYDEIVRVFPELENNLAEHSGLSVGWMVVRLNEDTSYSREQIAAWLCVKGGCKHPLDEPMVIEPGQSSIVLCDCSVCRDLGFVPDLVA